MMSSRITQELKELPLNTVEDAHAFFSMTENAKRQGIALPPISHLFFGRVDSGLKFDPYNIRTVYRDNRPLNYFVVTKDWVIRVNRRDAVYERVASTHEWLREAKTFAQISKIGFFRHYLRSKALFRLLNAVRRIKFERNRAFLTKRLLLITPAFENCLMRLRATATELQWKAEKGAYVKVVSLSTGVEDPQPQGYTVDEFSSKHEIFARKLILYMRDVEQRTTSLVTKRCADVTELVSGLKVIQKAPEAIGSVNKEVAARELRRCQMEQKRLVVDFESLPSLLRVAHHLLLEAIFQQACTTFFDLEVTIRKRKLNSIWHFRVECIIGADKKLSLAPVKGYLLDTVNTILGNSINQLADTATCLSSERTGSFSSAIDAVTIRRALLDDSLLDTYKKNILRRIETDYDDAKSKLASYESLIAVSSFLTHWREVSSRWEHILALGEPVFNSLTEQEIRSYAAKTFKSQAELEKIATRSFNSIIVSCSEILQKLSADLKTVLSTIDESLNQAIESNYNALKSEHRDWTGKLCIPDLKVEPFVAWYLNLQDSSAAFENFDNHVADLQNLYRLQAEFREKAHLGPAAESPDLVASLREPFQDAIKDAQNFQAANFNKIRDLLQKEYEHIIDALRISERRLATTFADESADEVDSPALEKLKITRDSLSETRHVAKQLDAFAQVLEMEPFNWSEIAVAQDELRKYVELWNIHKEAAELRNQLDSKVVDELDGPELESNVVLLFQRAFKAQKSTPGGVADILMESLAIEKAKLSTYVELCNPALKEQHWAELFKVASIPPVPPSRRTLRALERTGLMNEENATILREVVSNAVGVYELECHLSKLEQYWADHLFTVVPYAGRSNAFVIDAVDETREDLEEQQIVVQTCLSSKHVAPVQAQLMEWEGKLNLLHSVLDEWVGVQKMWMYLEFIFTSDDIKRQLPDESLLFISADRFFSSLMRRCAEEPLMAPLCLEGDGDALKKLQKCTYQLECIQKKIYEYLETKRVAFPRFYFLSNDELLSILSDSRNPLAVQPHLQKCFDNIKSLVFADSRTIVAMRSSEGEEVAFTVPVKVMGNVESWLNDVERAMQATLADRLVFCLGAYSSEQRTTWFFEHPAQCVTTVDQIMWTREVEDVIAETGYGSATAWTEYQAHFGSQLLQTVELVKLPLTALQRTVVCNLIVVDVHCRDVCAELAGTSPEAPQQTCDSVLDFGWQRQLRFYYDVPTAARNAGGSKADCFVRHGAAELPYGYEYLGNQARLVITPLTERAFLTCTAALHMQKGAAPQGPAGTGKTESVKDLGKALARPVVVFNCSDGLDYRMMSQMFAGLAQAGAWACFDEFNRIELEVLSVVAQQMLDITTAITQKQTSIDFEGHRIKLHPNFGVFITMNPGYAGRTELPDNLKALFRPVCMMIPNYALIAEIMFYAEGYGKAQALAAKMIRLYSLASQQLSRQDHYDFGMRAVKSILVLAGRLKRADPDTEEELLLVRAIREANLPKFLVDDRHLFLALLHDFFPAFTEVPAAPVSELIRNEAVRVLATTLVQSTACAVTTALKLQATEGLLFKIQQLFDTLMTRHGLMLVGHTMTGKTTVRNTLAAVLAPLGELLDRNGSSSSNDSNSDTIDGGGVVRNRSLLRSGSVTCADQQHNTAAALRRLDARCQSFFTTTYSIECNPKAISMTELYGDVNPLTREWQDGVFSSIVRELVRASATETKGRAATRHWIVFDGPVDAVWIENLNTVLDDSKMLCLVNGERIRILDNISLLFEVQDLRVASPATVSRCGMVYVDEECVDDGWTPVLRSLSQAAAADLGSRWCHERFMQLCQAVLPPLFQVIREECQEYIHTSNVQLGLNLFYLLKAGVEQLCGMIEEDRQEQQHRQQDEATVSSVVKLRAARVSIDTSADEDPLDIAAAARRYSHRQSRRHTRRRSSLAARTSALLLGDALFDALFVQSCVWGLGGNLTEATRDRFASAMLPLVRQESLFFPEGVEAEQGGVFNYAVDFETGDWRRWGEMVPAFQYDASASYFDLLVPTEQTVVLQYLLRSATTTQHHMLLNGLTGTGKSSTVNSYLQQVLLTEEATSKTAAFRFTLSAQTSAHALQNTIEMRLARRKCDREFGAPPGKRMIVAVIDDCNVPQLEEYGAAPPIELLRQMITQGGFYDRKKLFFKEVVQTMLIACCGEPGGGKNEMSPRFTSKMLCFCAPQLTPTSMRSIFSAILSGFFQTRGFATEVRAMTDAVVDSTIEAYRRIAVECLPTPDKTHCTFNLRDVSKVFQGILQVKPAHCSTPEALMQLWSHEASRVFHDRLVDDDDRQWWWQCCAEVITKHFSESDDSESSPPALPAAELSQQLPAILYGSWADHAKREYQRMGQAADLQAAAQQHLVDYNMQSTTPMNLVFFDEAVQHLSRICRIVSQPRGHALLVGIGGSGRASLCRLAAFIMNMDVQTVHIARNYGINDFRDEMRKALLECGARGKEVVFLLSDPQIVCGEMLEDVNNLLNAGEVPGMMGLEEMEVIVRGCREACVAAGRPDSRSSIYGYFVSQCCERFHLCLCMSPMSGVFRDRLRMFPALVNCTTIDWFSEWPQTALLAVAQAALKDSSNLPQQQQQEQEQEQQSSTEKLDVLMVYLQATVKEAAEQLFEQHHRRTHVTPTNYLAVLTLFNSTARQLRRDLQTHAHRYRNGLEKLDNANATIAQLQQQILEMQPGLTTAAQQVAEQKRSLAMEQEDADALKKAQSEEEAIAKGLMEEAESIRHECEAGLQQALPALEAAEQALQTLSAKDIQEIKTFTTPPSNVEKTMNAVLVLLGEKEGWASAKTCLGKMDFISRLTDYPRDTIAPACIRKLAVFVQDPDFVPDVIEKTSLPCRSMCMWVHAMYKYYFVAKEIAPKRARLAAAETKVEAARIELQAKQAALQKVLDRIAELQVAADATQAKADHFQREIETAQGRLTRADQLIHGLASERGRWEVALAKLEMQLGCVEGTAALAAGCVGYLGPFPLDYREVLLSRWRSQCTTLGIAFDATYALATMESDALVQQWSLHSLPRDTYSIQNATILHRSTQCCYMIDPQGQANTFVRKLERSRGHGAADLLQLKLNSPNFMRQVENAVQKGQAVLLEDVGETLDTALDPILLKQVRRVAGRSVVTLGDREVTYDERFHLYITTKLANPVLTPELQVKLTVIDFTVTREGLEEQLLADIVGCERASLQQRSDRCVVSIAAHREEIAALEAKVLQQLSDATGDVLDNVDLIHALQTSKVTAEKIAVELAAVEETNKTINVTRELYRPLAVRGSLLYGVIAQMAKVDSMYEYSLPFFKGLMASVMTSTRRSSGGGTLLQAVTPTPSITFRRDSIDPVREELRSRRGTMMMDLERSAMAFAGDAVASDEAVLPVEEVRDRVTMLVEEATWTSYRVLCRGLFGAHKLLFSFVVATTLLKSTGAITEAEWNLFLRGGGGAGGALAPAFAVPGASGEASRRPSYLSTGTWTDFAALCTLDAFAEVCRSFIASLSDTSSSLSTEADADARGGAEGGALPWPIWFTSTWGAEVLSRMPSSIAQLSLWHRVMAIKALRPKKLPYMAAELVTATLGRRYTEAPPFNLQEAFADGTKMTPLIFVLSPGVDPTSLFLDFAEEQGFGTRKYMLSLGQDQGVRAAQMIRDGQHEGAWVYLQNCHVYASWMPQLQAIVEAMNPTEIHDDFRLWLTSSPSPSFPAVVLQAGLKLTQEPPMGLRGNVLSILRSNIVAEMWTSAADSGNVDAVAAVPVAPQTRAASANAAVPCTATPPVELQRLVWTLAFFHVTVMERRRFSPLGWNIAYYWGAADFAAGVATIRTALSRYSADRLDDSSNSDSPAQGSFSTEELCYMLGVIDYGGRVTDEWDTRCLQVLTRRYFGDAEASTASPSDPLAPPAFPADGLTYAEVLQLAETAFPSGAEGEGGTAKAVPAESPARFGLHDNATLAVEQQLSSNLIDALVSMNAGGVVTSTQRRHSSLRPPAPTGEEGRQHDSNVGDTAAAAEEENPVVVVARELLGQLPALLPRCDPVVNTPAKSSSPSEGFTKAAALADPAPLHTLLSHETDLYNRLLSVMRSTLEELMRAVKGEVVVTAPLESLMQRLAFNQVPERWLQVGYLSLKPLGSFMEDLQRRVHFMRRWGEAGLPPSFWLSGVFFPQGFVTALLQARSRALRVPIDSLQLRFRALTPQEGARVMAATTAHASSDLTNTADVEPVVGAYVHGLFLEGCGWDHQRGGFVESAPGALTTELPVIHFEAITADELAATAATATTTAAATAPSEYACPLYKVRTRAGTLSTTGVSTNYVTCITLPSLDGVSGDHWTLRGVAALCALDD
ncbi:putative dynein heavy chain [Leptomonas pyrrhocoris]|uniref:Putative dynein heavy chain n=1 Tax=Leptomonas pyrrhocoris TaxID=157538 RepID=A0A0M9FW59_LEPPY|nr:putative dynein heavy chain [Leptomonas pyrrhocoris]KPA77305.1 putative dynein heavy chain [Leptomonas pyrrhocoris]|eukprot:XP_015655744.1 putative dynein heavy chain [Leptomonas pyrrhocoris]